MKPYYDSPEGQIYHGNVLEVLRQMPDESIHMCVTSPPYWGLRDYGNEPQIWDSEPPERCEGGREHVWGEWKENHDVREEKITAGKSRTTDRYYGNDKTRKFNGNHQKHTAGQFCQNCNAWRGSLGLEPTPELFIAHMVQIFREVRRVLRHDSVLFLNMGDSYASGGRSEYDPDPKLPQRAGNHRNRSTIGNGLKPKDLIGVPWRLALALQADGWYLRSAMPWVKRSVMPESCKDRPSSALEYMFLLSKSQRYYFDMESIKIKSSPDSHRRYARGRSNDHKWADGGPGNQTIAKSFDHMKVPGVTPKSAPAGSGIKANESFHAAVGDLVGSRNFRNTDLFFQSIAPPHGAIFCGDELVGLDINPEAQKAAHFATFPRRLVEVAVLSGTSEKGCCAECGAPWERVVEKSGGEKNTNFLNTKYAAVQQGGKESTSLGVKPPETKTTGWKPGCPCYGTDPLPEYPKQDNSGKKTLKDLYKNNEITQEQYEAGIGACDILYNEICETIQINRNWLLDLWKPLPTTPATVFDPFFGSGTSGIVAQKHGCNFIGIELSQKYLDEIAIPRIKKSTRQKGWNRFK